MRLRPILACIALLFVLPAPPGPVEAQSDAPQAALLGSALEAARVGDWAGAADFAARSGDPVVRDLLLWTRLRDGAGRWRDYEDFVLRNGDWPGLRVLRRAGERLMPRDLPAEEVFAFFDGEPPQTGTGALRLADALAATDREEEAEAEAVRGWRELSLGPPEQAEFLGRWGDVLAPHHVARLDMCLWEGWTREAEAMLRLVDEDWQALARARIATRRDTEGLTLAIRAVPGKLKRDPGLAFERYRYRVEKGRWEDAEEYLLEKSTTREALGRPEMWMERRANLARQALRRGEVDRAYRLASKSFGAGGADYADSEWLAGFIALTRMEDPERALAHFRRFEAVVATPISLGRAGYWIGLAEERLGDAAAAEAAFRAAARHQTSFYGQLAAERVGQAPDPALAGEAAPNWHRAAFRKSSVIRAGYLLHLAGEGPRASQFFRHAAEEQPAATRAALAQMAIDIGRPEIGIRIAKDAAAEGIIIAAQYYPLHAIAERDWPVPTEYAMAIARQESELNPQAASGVGARGLMQLMPATAEHMATLAGVDFDLDRVGADPIYNATLGTEYLSRMLDRYRGSYILATAAYNAGPGRVDEWIRTFGDPRRPEVDPVVWVEMIPFSETRNYVMRVLEALHVYRARLEGRTGPVRLSADMTRTG